MKRKKKLTFCHLLFFIIRNLLPSLTILNLLAGSQKMKTIFFTKFYVFHNLSVSQGLQIKNPCTVLFHLNLFFSWAPFPRQSLLRSKSHAKNKTRHRGAGTKYLTYTTSKTKGLFWVTVSEVSAHGMAESQAETSWQKV